MSPVRRPDGMPPRGGASLRLLLDLLRPGATSLGVVVPLVVLLSLVALVVALVGEVLVPWAVYPAL